MGKRHNRCRTNQRMEIKQIMSDKIRNRNIFSFSKQFAFHNTRRLNRIQVKQSTQMMGTLLAK